MVVAKNRLEKTGDVMEMDVAKKPQNNGSNKNSKQNVAKWFAGSSKNHHGSRFWGEWVVAKTWTSSSKKETWL